MTPVHSNKNGLRHRYYQSWVLNHGYKSKAGAVYRVPAHELEDFVAQALRERSDEIKRDKDEGTNTMDLLESVDRIEVLEGQIVITLKGEADETSEANDPKETINISWSKPSPFRKKEFIGSNAEITTRRPMRSVVRSKLLKGIAQGRLWLGELVDHKDRTVSDIATQHGLSERSIRSNISLGLLAPEIVEAAIDGRLPYGLTVTQLTDLSLNWNEQKHAAGLV